MTWKSPHFPRRVVKDSTERDFAMSVYRDPAQFSLDDRQKAMDYWESVAGHSSGSLASVAKKRRDMIGSGT